MAHIPKTRNLFQPSDGLTARIPKREDSLKSNQGAKDVLENDKENTHPNRPFTSLQLALAATSDPWKGNFRDQATKIESHHESILFENDNVFSIYSSSSESIPSKDHKTTSRRFPLVQLAGSNVAHPMSYRNKIHDNSESLSSYLGDYSKSIKQSSLPYLPADLPYSDDDAASSIKDTANDTIATTSCAPHSVPLNKSTKNSHTFLDEDESPFIILDEALLHHWPALDPKYENPQKSSVVAPIAKPVTLADSSAFSNGSFAAYDPFQTSTFSHSNSLWIPVQQDPIQNDNGRVGTGSRWDKLPPSVNHWRHTNGQKDNKDKLTWNYGVQIRNASSGTVKDTAHLLRDAPPKILPYNADGCPPYTTTLTRASEMVRVVAPSDKDTTGANEPKASVRRETEDLNDRHCSVTINSAALLALPRRLDFTGSNRRSATNSLSFNAEELLPKNKGFLTRSDYAIIIANYASERSIDGAKKAECILRYIISENEASRSPVRPDGGCYNKVLHAYANLGDVQKAEQVIELMHEIFEAGDHLAEPNNRHYTTLIFAWQKSGKPEGPERCEQILETMHSLHELGKFPKCKPDSFSYTSVVHCWANSERRDAATRAEALFRKMIDRFQNGDQGMRPDTVAYSNLLNAIAKPNQTERAEAIVWEMVDEFLKGNVSCKPTTRNFNTVLAMWSTSCKPDAPLHCENMVRRWLKLYETSIIDIKPDKFSYGLLLKTW